MAKKAGRIEKPKFTVVGFRYVPIEDVPVSTLQTLQETRKELAKPHPVIPPLSVETQSSS